MARSLGLPYWILVTGAAAWSGAALLAPWARSQGWPLAELLYFFFSPLCHQNPDRSFFCAGEPLAACHRCTGLYLGLLLGLLVLPRLENLRLRLVERPRLVLLFALPMAVDYFLLENTPTTRFVSGLLAAFPMGLFVWLAAEQLWPDSDRATEKDTICTPSPAKPSPH